MICGIAAAVLSLFAGTFTAAADQTNSVVTTTPVFVPDTSHSKEPLPDGVLAWSSLVQATNVTIGQPQVHFVFSLTNVSSGNVAVLDAHASCGCTQPELPPRPWIIPPGGHGEIGATVNLAGIPGMFPKYITVTTDKGKKDVYMQITVLPAVIPTLTDAERARGVAMAKADRQAVFKNDCATCHVKPGEGKYGKALYDAVCAICHEAEHRASIVPDLHNLKTPTNDEFWRTWIAQGKPGTLMPAFATAEGGPLNDRQIATVAAHLNMVIPSHPAPAMTNAPPAN